MKDLLRVDILVRSDGALDGYGVFVIFKEMNTSILVFLAPVKVDEVVIDCATGGIAHWVIKGVFSKQKANIL